MRKLSTKKMDALAHLYYSLSANTDTYDVIDVASRMFAHLNLDGDEIMKLVEIIQGITADVKKKADAKMLDAFGKLRP